MTGKLGCTCFWSDGFGIAAFALSEAQWNPESKNTRNEGNKET